jgi:Mg2+ and Co2+ transporter CorA
MDLSTKLIQRLLLSNGGYQKTEQIIIETIIEHLEDEWLKMESLFEDESYEITKEDKKKYDDLEEAISILEEHRDTMMYIMKMAENKEKEENNRNNNNEDGCDERVNQHLEFEVD